MKIVVAMDSFKGSLSSIEAGEAVKQGIHEVDASAQVEIYPVADGGEGTSDVLTQGLGGQCVEITVTGPLGQPVQCQYGILEEKSTALIEMSAAAGLPLVPEEERNPMNTTTYGVGEMIVDALSRGCRKFIIGIGGSSTNDGGVGMLQALGYEFTDDKGEDIPFGAKGLEKLVSISSEHAIRELKECSFSIACDVTNPLCGEFGCSAVFAPQKGASKEAIKKMDAWLLHYGKLSDESVMNVPGTGAAGGLGFAFLAFLNAKLESGIRLILQETGFTEGLVDADLVITGEGRLDEQTIMGKTPVGVAKIAKERELPVIAFSGSVSERASACHDAGIDAYFPILREPMPVEKLIKKEIAFTNLKSTAQEVMRVFCLKT